MAAWSKTPGGVASITRTSRGSPFASTVYSTVTEPLTRCDKALLGNSGGTYRVRLRLAAREAGFTPAAAAARWAAETDFGALWLCCTARISFGSAPQRFA